VVAGYLAAFVVLGAYSISLKWRRRHDAD
jgi:hypothetical protein